MATTIRAAAVSVDPDTGSYFELAARAARTCLERADVYVDEVGMLVNTGLVRDNNLAEPAGAALIQQRIGLGLDYYPGQTPAFSFDLAHGAAGLLYGISVVECCLATGEVEYALLLAGEAHPSTERGVAGFPYSTGAAALLLGTSPVAGGFGRLHTCDPTGPIEPATWFDLSAAGTNGRSSIEVRPGGDPLDPAVEVVRAGMAEEGLDRADFTAGRAVLLAPAPDPGFPARAANALGLPPESVVGVAPEIGDPYSAAPVHAYLNAQRSGRLDTADTVLFLAAFDASAACLTYRPRARSTEPTKSTHLLTG
ncbi:hypothetical protein OG203_24920 [Nocardia sp. NBC_01499]|uniref:hypothetical protein n=1 Tax=Nocardia sp. NBC_01499 TaxID=2903597 RepID=UPI00386B4398